MTESTKKGNSVSFSLPVAGEVELQRGEGEVEHRARRHRIPDFRLVPEKERGLHTETEVRNS
ncbi:hypothetical protein AB0I51_11235 [Streptomyces sp. NPDC050549]|uniref:hypothetical protein n=1 Tax=Streptomyces sp. NPDC050549 TaxID=3155406 RepID=UPI00344AA88A